MQTLIARFALIAFCASLPLAATAGVTGTHGPDRGSGGMSSKPKPTAAAEDQSEQAAKPDEKKEVEVSKDAK